MTRVYLAFVVALLTTVASAAQTPRAPGASPSISPIRGDLYQAQDGDQLTVFLIGTDGILLGDPLNVAFATWLRDELAMRFPNRPVRTVVQTSHLLERAAGGKVFKDAGATIMGHRRFNEALQDAGKRLPPTLAPLDVNHDGKLQASELSGAPRAPTLLARDLNHDGVLTPGEINNDTRYVDKTYDTRTTIKLGEKAVNLVHIGVSYAPELTVIDFPAERIVFSANQPFIAKTPFSFGPYRVNDVVAWLHGVEAIDFDTLILDSGEHIARSDVIALGKYVEGLIAEVRQARGRFLDLAEIASRPAPPADAAGPQVGGRPAQLASIYRSTSILTVDGYGAGLFSLVGRNTLYCANYAVCQTPNGVTGGMGGFRVSLGRSAFVVEGTGSNQFIWSRESSTYDDGFAHKDTRTSVLFRYDLKPDRRFSYAVLGGLSQTIGDSSGLDHVKEGFAPFAGRHLLSAHATISGFTAGADLTFSLARRVDIFLPLRVTSAMSDTIPPPGGQIHIWPGRVDVQGGAGLTVRLWRVAY